MKGYIERFFSWVVKKSDWVIVLVFAFLVVLSFGIFKLYIDNDLLNWFSSEDRIASLTRYVNEKFKNNNPILIMVEFEDDVFSKSNLIFVRELSRFIEGIEGVSGVISITEVEDIRTTREGIVVEKLFQEEIPSGRELDILRTYVMSRESYKGSLVSLDSKSVNIVVIPEADLKSDIVARKVRSEVDGFIKNSNVRCDVYYGGSPMQINSMSKLVSDNILKLIPVVSIIVLVTLSLSMRTLVGTFLPLATVLIALAMGMGIMGYLEYPLTTFGVAIPVILIAVGNAYSIHVINEYYEKLSQIGDKDEAIVRTMVRIFIPVLMSGLTTIASFVSIGLANEMISSKNFATVSSLGIGIATVLTLIFVPAILTKLNLIHIKHHHENTSKLMMYISRLVFSARIPILFVFIIVALLSIYFISKIHVEVDYLRYFDKDTEPRKVAEVINKNFDGFFEFKTYIKGDIQDPVLLKIMYIIEEEQRYYLNGKSKPQSISEIIAKLNEGMVGLKSIPDTRYEVQNLWFFIEGSKNVSRVVSEDKDEVVINMLIGGMSSTKRYELIEMTKRLLSEYSNSILISPMDDIEYTSEIISKAIYNRILRVGITNTLSKEDFKNQIKSVVKNYLSQNMLLSTDYEGRRVFINKFSKYIYDTLKIDEKLVSAEDMMYALSPSVWNKIPIPSKTNKNSFNVIKESEVIGIARLFTNIENKLLQNQLTSLVIIILAVLIMNFFAFRSFLEALISIVPIIFTLLVNFGVMGLFGIYLDFVTVTIASIAVGVGIDYTIHFISRYVYEVKNGLDYERAFYTTFSTTGKGIIANALAVGLGFATLLISDIVPLRNFGLMMFLTMLVSSISALTLLPIFIIALKKRLRLV